MRCFARNGYASFQSNRSIAMLQVQTAGKANVRDQSPRPVRQHFAVVRIGVSQT
jgi:hypothetical protein